MTIIKIIYKEVKFCSILLKKKTRINVAIKKSAQENNRNDHNNNMVPDAVLVGLSWSLVASCVAATVDVVGVIPK